jgi:sorbitol/mannitol transport system substrate-binding protein
VKKLFVLLLVAVTLISMIGTVSAVDKRAYEGTSLNLLLKEGYEIDVIKSYEEEFEEDTGIELNIEIYDEPTTRQKFIFDVTSRTGSYDITSVSFWYLPEYHRNDWLASLDNYLDNETPWDFHMKDIPESALDTFSVDDSLYSMPHTIIGGAFYYRKDIFEKYDLEVPETTKEIVETAKKLDEMQDEVYSIIGRGVANFSSFGSYAGWAWTYGAKALDDNYNPQFDSPEWEEAMNDYVSILRDYGPPGIASMNFNDIGQMFAEGKVAMMFDTTGWGGMVNNPEVSNVAGDVGIKSISGPNGEELQWIYMEGLGVNKFSNKKEAAALFLQWRMSRDITAKEAFELKRWDVPNLHVLEMPEYKELAAENNAGAYAEYLPKSWAGANIEYWPWIPEFTELGDSFMRNISAALSGDVEINKALDNSQNEIEKIMEDAGY